MDNELPVSEINDSQEAPSSDELREQPSESYSRLDSSNTNGTKKGAERRAEFIRENRDYIEKVQFSYLKAIVCGNYIEFHEAELPFILGRPPLKKSKETIDSDKPPYKRNVKRTKDTLRRLVLGNFTKAVKLLTLTFNNENDFDISDISLCNKKFSIFMHLLRRIYDDFKYIAVLELQKRNAVHYHILCDLPFIEKKKIEAFWGLGFIDIRRTNEAYQALIYILKYFHKSVDDKRFRNKRIYFCSKNLIRPRNYFNEKAYALRRLMAEKNVAPTYSYTMENPERGWIAVEEYNLNQPKPRGIILNEPENK